MSIRLLLVMILAALLFGCSFDRLKEEAPVQVEDLSNPANASETDESGVQAYGSDDNPTSGFSELDDPQSPLSVRVIYFQYDSSEVQAEYRSIVEAHSLYLNQNPGTYVTLEGHSDERGSREYNLALGERRAQSIKQQMTLLGVSSNQIRLISYGEERPTIEGHDETSWQENRRVEILY